MSSQNKRFSKIKSRFLHIRNDQIERLILCKQENYKIVKCIESKNSINFICRNCDEKNHFIKKYFLLLNASNWKTQSTSFIAIATRKISSSKNTFYRKIKTKSNIIIAKKIRSNAKLQSLLHIINILLMKHNEIVV